MTETRFPLEASNSSLTSDNSGARRDETSWAPLNLVDNHGPSKWIPAIVDKGRIETKWPTCDFKLSLSSVTKDAKRVVVPFIR